MSGTTYGRAGEALGSFTGQAGEAGRAVGRKAEVATARLMDDYVDRYGLTVFHSVRVRGGAADIDHVLVGRRGVVLIDTKAWKSGLYVTVGRWAFRWVRGCWWPRRFRPGESTSLGRSVLQMRRSGIPVVAGVVAVWPTGARGRVHLTLLRYPGAKRVRLARGAVRLAVRLAGRRPADPETVELVARWVRANEGRR